jgi:mannose-6-phosphate isomerase-like protein (cupin superfamily)
MAEPDVAFTTTDNPAGERMITLRRQLGVTSFGMNLITLAPRQRNRIHVHEHQEEVYLVLEGELTLAIEGEEHTVKRGGLVRVGPSTRRQLINRGTTTLASTSAATPAPGSRGTRTATAARRRRSRCPATCRSRRYFTP